MITLKGIAASPGVAIGKAFVHKKRKEIQAQQSTDVKRELERLEEALEASKLQLREIKEAAAREIGKNEAGIFEAHLLILEDPDFIGDIKKNVEEKRLVAEAAVQETVKKYVEMFESMKSEYFKARALDVQDVGGRVINNLQRITYSSLARLREKIIVVADILTPSDTAQMNKEMVLGFATDTGGLTSHTAIIARSLGIPAVVGLGNVTDRVSHGEIVIIDGFNGIVIINPDEETIAKYRDKAKIQKI